MIKAQRTYIDTMLAQNNIILDVNEYELKHIPDNKSFICITNELIPGVDDYILIKLFDKLGLQFKVLNLSKRLPDQNIEDAYFKANSSQNHNSKLSTLFSSTLDGIIKEAINKDISLGISLKFASKKIRRLKRTPHHQKLIHCIKNLEVDLLPLYLKADFENGLTKITVRIGSLIKVKEQQAFSRTSQFRKYIRSKIYALGSALEVKDFFIQEKQDSKEGLEPIAPAVAQELIEEDIKKLTFHNLIASRNDYDVFVAEAKEIPNLLTQIGRLREITFRQVGEGTGKNLDLDEFDLYYRQLIIWDRVAKKIVGGYRLGLGDEIFSSYGVQGFYIHSLFKIKKGFYPIMQQSVELGRSYVVEAYQKKRLPLFLLWKGILFFLLQNPQYRYLYGPLSISKYYSALSKSLIVAFVKKTYFDNKLAKFLKPRKPFKVKIDNVNVKVLLKNFNGDISNLGTFIEDIEPTHFNIPVLMKQYIKQNAKFISFNVDPNFSDVLDGFMILDLNEVPYTTIEALKKEY